MDAVVACLRSTLSPDRAVRVDAERQLMERAYPRHDAEGTFGVDLACVFQSDTIPLAERQAAGIALRKYIHERWSIYFESFLRRAKEQGETESMEALPEPTKHEIRTVLLAALQDAERKIRLLASQLLSIVGSCDFPDHFPELFSTLQAYLQSYGQRDAMAEAKVHGAMKFLSDFVQVELDENQLLIVAREFIPLLQELLSSSFGDVSAHIKARCILVFRQCLTSLYMAKDTFTDAVNEAVKHYLPSWLNAMQILLDPSYFASASWADSLAWEELGLRREILRTIGVASRFKKVFAEFGPALLGLCLANLQALAPLFVQTELEESVTPPSPAEGDLDVAATVPALAMAAFTLLSDTFHSPSMRHLLVDGGVGGEGQPTEAFRELLRLMRTYAQVTQDDEATWATDMDAFVAEDDVENMAVTLRTTTMDLMDQLLDLYPLPTLRELREQVEALSVSTSESSSWWKPVEAQLMLLGQSHEAVEDILMEHGGPDVVSMQRVFEKLVLPFLDPTPAVFLRGRCFVFASQYASELPDDLAARIFSAAQAVMQAPDSDEVPLHMKLSAVRTICNFGQMHSQLVEGQSSALLAQLAPLLSQATGSTLMLLLDAMEACLPRRGSSDTLPTLRMVTEAVLATWYAHTADPPVELSVASLLEDLVKSPLRGSATQTVALCVPFLCMRLTPQEELTVPPSAAALLRSVLTKAPIDALADMVAPILQHTTTYLQHTDDVEAAQSLIHCLTLLLQKRPDEALAWHRDDGTPSLQVMLHIIERLLTMDEDVCGMSFGTLLVTLFVQAGAGLSPVMPALVQALARKVAETSSSTTLLALLFPLAYLFAEHTEPVVHVLHTIPLSTETALQAVVRRWLAEIEHVHSWFVLNVHIAGLCQLLAHWPAPLESMHVDGDILPKSSDGTCPEKLTVPVIITRSRAKASTYGMPTYVAVQQYQQIPAFAKAVKVLLQEWKQAQEKAAAAASDAPKWSSLMMDDGAAEWADDDEEEEEAALDMAYGRSGGGVDLDLFRDLYSAGIMDEGDLDEDMDDAPLVDVPGTKALVDMDRVVCNRQSTYTTCRPISLSFSSSKSRRLRHRCKRRCSTCSQRNKPCWPK